MTVGPKSPNLSYHLSRRPRLNTQDILEAVLARCTNWQRRRSMSWMVGKNTTPIDRVVNSGRRQSRALKAPQSTLSIHEHRIEVCSKFHRQISQNLDHRPNCSLGHFGLLFFLFFPESYCIQAELLRVPWLFRDNLCDLQVCFRLVFCSYSPARCPDLTKSPQIWTLRPPTSLVVTPRFGRYYPLSPIITSSPSAL